MYHLSLPITSLNLLIDTNLHSQHLSANGGPRLGGRDLLGQFGDDERTRLSGDRAVLRTDLLLAGEGDTTSGNEDSEANGAPGLYEFRVLGANCFLCQYGFVRTAAD